MNELLKKIHEYQLANGAKEEELSSMDSHSVYLAMGIADYAHRSQRRENGEPYMAHPLRCLERYRRMVGIVEGDPFCIDGDLMAKHHVPFEGVQEVCLLHDVIEDTEVTPEDIKGIFYDLGFKTYFDLYIDRPLRLITHDKEVPYDNYIALVLENPIASIVKMMDLQDNLIVLDLVALNDYAYKRALGYLQYLYLINSKYQFIENIQSYLSEYRESSQLVL